MQERWDETMTEEKSQYDKDIDTLIEENRKLRPDGMYVAFSGSTGFIIGPIDSSLPYGVIRNGDGKLYDVLTPEERVDHPLPPEYKPGEYRARVVKVDA